MGALQAGMSALVDKRAFQCTAWQTEMALAAQVQ